MAGFRLPRDHGIRFLDRAAFVSGRSKHSLATLATVLKRRRRRLVVCACRHRSETMAEREGKSRVGARGRLESSRGVEGR